jgi:hypothetical protein
MISRAILTSLIAALLLGAAQASDHRSPQVHYTRHQRRARGVWKSPAYSTTKPAWIAINLGDSTDSMSVLWPWGLGCWNLSAEIHGNEIQIKREDLVATITLQGEKKPFCAWTAERPSFQ